MITPTDITFRFVDLFALEQIYYNIFYRNIQIIQTVDLNADGWKIDYINHFVALYDTENYLRFFGVYNDNPMYPYMGITFWNFPFIVRQAFLNIANPNDNTLNSIMELCELLLNNKYMLYNNIRISKTFDRNGSPEYTLNPEFQNIVNKRIEELLSL